MNRAILLILDGLGVGEMPDVTRVRPEDVGAHTLAHILADQKISLPVLTRLGLGAILQRPDVMPIEQPIACYGTCMLMHHGADTYAGHNEIMGSLPKVPMKTFMIEVKEEVRQALKTAGYNVHDLFSDTGTLLVNDKVIIADNMETDPGQIINVTGSLDEIPFEQIYQVALVVRQVVKTSRVIALGGTNITVERIIQSCFQRGRQCGVNTPVLEIYNKDYQVRHLGYGVDPERQIPAILQRAGIPVYLYGKIADVVQGEATERDPIVDTHQLFERVFSRLAKMDNGLICATVQETDLAGHEQNCEKYGKILRLSDQKIGILMEMLAEKDLLIITADHGNDPTIGHSRHTREVTPLLLYQKGSKNKQPINLGVRSTLADIAASIADYFQVSSPENGRSVWDTTADK